MIAFSFVLCFPLLCHSVGLEQDLDFTHSCAKSSTLLQAGIAASKQKVSLHENKDSCDTTTTTDSYEDGCADYASHPSWCGNYDDNDFSSNAMCCGCGVGGNAPLSASSPAQPTPPPPPQGEGDCDTTTATDSYEDGCTDYSIHPTWCGKYDDNDFSSNAMCCGCGGGGNAPLSASSPAQPTPPPPPPQGEGDCDTTTATDPAGDGCSNYAINPDWCGKYDDNDFSSDDMCCGCQHGSGSLASPSSDTSTEGWVPETGDVPYTGDLPMSESGDRIKLEKGVLELGNDKWDRVPGDNGHGPYIQNVLSRSSWVKTLRCIDASEESCEECSSSEDCFVAGNESADSMELSFLHVRLSGQSPWTRFLNIIHVKCPTSSSGLRVNAILKELKDGYFTIYWDGEVLGPELDVPALNTYWSFHMYEPVLFTGTFPISEEVPMDGYEISKMIPVASGQENGHELIIEAKFATIPRQTFSWLAVLSRLWLYESGAFTQCQDTKMCLQTLDKTLRNSNEMQFQCLNDMLLDNPHCTSWRSCLNNVTLSNHQSVEDQLRNILAASLHPPPSPASGQEATVATDAPVVEKLCMDPRIEDPEGWACDCWEKMQERCVAIEPLISNYDVSLCLRAQFCSQDKVCQHWKSLMCHGLDVYEAKLSDFSLSEGSKMETLVQRPAATHRLDPPWLLTTGKNHNMNLDGTMNSKMCG